MVICCDTSFLFALYANDAHTQRALAWAKRSTHALSITSINEFELGNAFRFAEFRKAIPAGASARFQALFEADVAGGRLIVETCRLGSVMAEAKRLSRAHTLSGGHRAMDILHIACALELGAAEFLTFDLNQKRLALALGISSPL
jgi:predicted nucleic acid-binding protein